MDLIVLFHAIVLGIVEGLTEFLPISSTGHLILVGALLGFDDTKAKVFDIAIQTGAIAAVVMVYWPKISQVAFTFHRDRHSRRFVANVLIAFMPAVALGLLFGKTIQTYLFTPTVVAAAFIVGGFIILWAERIHDKHPAQIDVHTVDDMDWRDALHVGLIQCLALIPGTSRSGATIIGGMLLGLSRKAATEFSFFLAIPTLTGAGVYSMYKERAALSLADAPLFIVGMVVSFLSAWVCIRWLLRYVATHSFVGFAWYRIVFGLVVICTAWTGMVEWTA